LPLAINQRYPKKKPKMKATMATIQIILFISLFPHYELQKYLL